MTQDDMVRTVVEILTAEDRAGRIERAIQTSTDAGMTMLSLAYVASRQIAGLAEQVGGAAAVHTVRTDGQPMAEDDPHQFATLLVGTAANGDQAGSLDIATQVLEQGRAVTRDVVVLLAELAERATAPLGHIRFIRQNPQEN